MSFSSMLAHRCVLVDSRETSVDGSSVYSWQIVQSGGVNLILPCFLDLNFLRKGKDLMWVEAAGRPSDRTGVIFFKGSAPVKSGMRILIDPPDPTAVPPIVGITGTRGPRGAFSIEGALDEAWTPRKKHHLEFGVIEVATVISRAALVGDPNT